MNHQPWHSEDLNNLLVNFCVAKDLMSALESQIFFQNKSAHPAPGHCCSHSYTMHSKLYNETRKQKFHTSGLQALTSSTFIFHFTYEKVTFLLGLTRAENPAYPSQFFLYFTYNNTSRSFSREVLYTHTQKKYLMDTIPPRKIIYFAVKIVQPFINFNWTSCLRCLPRRKLKPKESEKITQRIFHLTTP